MERKNMVQMRVLADGLRFPEGPVAMKDGSIAFVEIERGTVSRVAPDGTTTVIAQTGGGPNGLAVGPDSAFYVCNNGGFLWKEVDDKLHVLHGTPPSYAGGSIQRIDPVTGEVRTLYERCADVKLCGPNDLVFDAHGGFYFTDFGKTRARERDIGCVYYALPDGSKIVEVIHPIMAPNGIALSPDGHTLYVAETETCRLWAFDILEAGVVKKQPSLSPNGGRLICGLPGYQRLDSMALEASGNICVGTLITGQITVFSPQGEVLRQVPFPDANTTNICFGGKDMKTAYVTQSITGKLIEMQWPEPGLVLNFSA
jgi:gluconolactonase